MHDLLSPEERDALLGAFGPPKMKQPEITLAAFPSVSQLDPERTATLSAALKKWAEASARDLARYLRAPCVVQAPRMQMTARTGLPPRGEAAFWGLLNGEEGRLVLMTLPLAFAAALCERSFGAPLQPVEERDLTTSESGLLREMANGWMASLGRRWPGPAVRPCGEPEPGTVVDEEGALNWMRFTSEIVCGPLVGALSVTMAPSTARLALGEQQTAAAAEVSERALRARLGDVPLELRAVLGEARFTLDEIAGLRVGDVISLDRRSQEPILIALGNQPWYRARAGLSGQVVALELLEPVCGQGDER